MSLYLDVSSLARWTGPPVGIVRVERALAAAAQASADTRLVVFDKRAHRFRTLDPAWAPLILGWHGALDVPEPNQSPLSRQRWFAALERLRLTRPRLAPLADRAQRALLALRPHGHRLHAPDGQRIAHLPPDLALGPAVSLTASDTLLSAGSDWFHLEAATLAALKRAERFRYACLCYDLIPITHPHFYDPADVALVTRHWRTTLPNADLVIVNAHCIAADLAAFCAAEALPSPDIAVLPLGVDPPPPDPAPPPPPLRPGHYALFVSTLEPRKGHALLLRVWRRLLADGIPQAHDCRLVFVGRPGWMVDPVLAELRAGVERVHHWQGLDDATLDALYAGCAFALYPSAYEGFGLPVIEAFARAKPVLAAAAGALPETIAGAYPCLPPDDEDAWRQTLAHWIATPPAPPPRQPLAWPAAAAAILHRAAAPASKIA